jgi:predicted glycosyltransferase
VVEPARSDFASLLKRCHLSVSQAGYNTAVDLIETNARAVLVPFATEGETEQTQRAAAMAARGWAQVVPEAELSAERLAGAIERASAASRRGIGVLDCAGAEQTARVVERLLAERSA